MNAMHPLEPSSAKPPARLQRLQTRIGLALAALTLGSALLLAGVLSQAAEREILRLSSTNLENLAEQMARELSRGMDRFGTEIADQAQRERFSSRTSTVEQMRAALDQFKQAHPEFAYVCIIDAATGQVVAANGGIFEGGNAQGRQVYEEGKKGPFLGDVHKAVRLAELLPRPANGEALRFLDVAAPVFDEAGHVFRVFATHIGWQWTQQIRDQVFGPLKERRGVEMVLVDTKGKVVLASSNTIAVGTELAFLHAPRTAAQSQRIVWPDGEDALTYVAGTQPHGRFQGFGWKVVARQPYALALGPAHNLRYGFLAGALALGLAAAGLAWYVAARLVRPVRLLAEAAKQAAAGNGGAPVGLPPLSHSVGEVSEVQRALATLSANAREQTLASATQERQFGVLAESLPQGVWQADARGWLQYVNKAWIYAGAAEAGGHVLDLQHLIHEDDRENFVACWKSCLATGDDLKVRCRLIVPPLQETRWFDLEAHAVMDEARQPVRWVGTVFDVHEMMMLAEKTERALAEERIARAEAERVARMRDEFLATVSHELRSPLSAITGWSEILARRSGGDETLIKAATVIRRNAQLQASLIDDLLDMSAVLAGKLTLDPVPLDIVEIAKEVTLSHLHAAQRKGIALACREAAPVLVEADPKRIAQVLANLIGNALKFTDTSGRVDVIVWAQGGKAHVRVADNGRGITPEFLPHVFDRMRQQDASVTRHAGGLGLGLAIAHAVVELHQGGITADSPGPGAGSAFTFTLPLAQVEEMAPRRPLNTDVLSGTDLGGLNILLVDDEQDAREVAQVALSSLGASVRLAASAREALELVRTQTFDVLVSDIGMPEMDGLTLVRRVRQLPAAQGGQVPAVALTAFAMETERQAGIRAGFQAYVAKPISLCRLSEGIVAARKASITRLDSSARIA